MPQATPLSTRYRIITLTDAAPVRIRESDWPVIAKANWQESKLEFQSRRAWITVRQHDDGRAIVYGGFDSPVPTETSLRAGELLADGESLPASIRRVVSQINAPELLGRDCIADLPPVGL